LIKVDFDTSDFKVRSMQVKARINGATINGMEVAMRQFMQDALEEVPKCPVKTGALAGSHSIFVNGMLVAVSAKKGPGIGEATPRLAPFLPPKRNVIEGILVAHKPYAATQHEGIRLGTFYQNYTNPQSGPKWVLAKLLKNGQRYLSKISRKVKAL